MQVCKRVQNMKTAKSKLGRLLLGMLLLQISCSQQASDGTIPGDILISGHSGKKLADGDLIAFRGFTRMAGGELSNKSNVFYLVLVCPKDSPIIGGGSQGGSTSNIWVYDHKEIW